MPLCAAPLDPTGSVNSVHFHSHRQRTEHLLRKGVSDSVEPIPLVAPVFHVFLLPIILVSLTTHYLIPPCSCLRHLCVESKRVFRRWRTNSCAASQVVSDTTKFFGTLRNPPPLTLHSGSRCVNRPDGSCAYSLFDLGTTETRVRRLGSPPLTWITKGAGGGGAHMPKYL